MFHEPGATALDLYTTTSLLLNVFDILSTVPNDSRAQIKSRDRLQINRNSLLGPFALSLNVNVVLPLERKLISNSPSHIHLVRPALVALVS